jgi:2-oxoisovalerate ferredoxin oxidoreductase beta subunit
MVKHQKPAAFYDTFERKGPGQKVTHYCPGCGHGTAHKLIAEAIVELGVQDRVVFISPVGCSVFAYYYFDVGNVEAAHGRAPAVATGIRRSLKDAVVISYQGDGDLAGIGMGAIIHAANRGENITVYFINNAIYGMTGGQMAPTTLIGQKTLTTPLGRSLLKDGNAIGMCELINSLTTPVYIERVSLGDPKRVLKAKKAVSKGLRYQVEGRGFSFVEILSPCPVNWKMSAGDSRKWLIENLEPIFPVAQFRDEPEKHSGGEIEYPFLSDNELKKLFQVEKEVKERPVQHHAPDQLVKIAGFGGQGVMSAGVLLADCTIMEGLNATWLPSYGPEMRGGTANASVIVSENAIGSPVVDKPNVLIAMNGPSLTSFEDDVAEGGMVLVNSSIVSEKVKRKDIKTYYIPASDIAKENGLLPAANVVILTIYFLLSGAADVETLRTVIPLSIKKKNLTATNLKMIDAGIRYYEENLARGPRL